VQATLATGRVLMVRTLRVPVQSVVQVDERGRVHLHEVLPAAAVLEGKVVDSASGLVVRHSSSSVSGTTSPVAGPRLAGR
jgi:hypothetical protein